MAAEARAVNALEIRVHVAQRCRALLAPGHDGARSP